MTTSSTNEAWDAIDGVRIRLVDPGADPRPFDDQPAGLILEVSDDQGPRLRVSRFSVEGLLASSDEDSFMRMWRVDWSLMATEANDLLRRVAPLAARCVAGVIEPDEYGYVYNDDALAAEREIAAVIFAAEDASGNPTGVSS